MSQGVLLAMAAQWMDRHAGDATGEEAEHLLVEATEAAFGFRSDCTLGSRLLDVPLEVDRERAARRGGPRSYLHTAGVAVADRDGQVVSSLLSVFDDFGSGVFVPELGFVLNNRAAGFTHGRNTAAPGKRPVHTLAPALLETASGAVLGLATPGADGQVQTLLQVLWRLRAGEPLSAALAAPRWRSQDGRLLVEIGHPAADALADRGHDVELRPAGDPVFGAVVAAGITGGTPVAAGDWRRRVSSGALPFPLPGADGR
jgi:gamma-glutamyltranspeptidase/glutathione hydrolase